MSGMVLPLSRGKEGDRVARLGAGGVGVDAEALQDRHYHAVLLLEQGGEEVRWRDLGVGSVGREPLSGGDSLLGLLREAILLHGDSVSP